MAIKLVAQNKTDRQALAEWDELLLAISNSTPIDISETPAQQKERIKKLHRKGNEEAWIEYYFPKYAFAKPAQFQISSTRAVVHSSRIYQRRAWARGLAKSTRRMMEICYLIFVQKHRLNLLLISKTETNATRLLAPYKANLEGNLRLINDYGRQVRTGKWKEEEFITRSNCSFRAVGAEQNPRGAKLEEMRINTIIFDDADDDEVCRNADRLEYRWQWVERAVIPTVDIAKNYWIFFDNNIIAEDSLAVRAAVYASHVELVNIRDKDGNSNWPQKNSEADIDAILNKMSYESGQTEFFNNPMSQGKTFAEIYYGKCPPISKLQFIGIYADPATSNKDKPLAKSTNNTSAKAVFVIGWDGNKLYIYYGFLGVVNNGTFIDWMYECYAYCQRCNAKVTYVDIENNSLQDPFYTQVFIPLIAERKNKFGILLPVIPDARAKPDKWFRIEGNLEPLNRTGRMILNEAEAHNPHFKALEAQFKAAKASSRALDGPDCIEGGYHKAKERLATNATTAIILGQRPRNLKRY